MMMMGTLCTTPHIVTAAVIRNSETANPMEKEKSHIRETKHLLTDADSSTDTKKILLVRVDQKRSGSEQVI